MRALFHWLRDQFDWKKIWRSRTTRSFGHRLAMAGICGLLAVGPLLPLFVQVLPESIGNTISNDWAVQMVADFYERGEFLVRDYIAQYGKPGVVDPRLTFVAIDETSTSLTSASLFSPEEIAQHRALQLMSKSWPWPREAYACILDRLFGAGARVVVLDLLFPTPSRYGEEDDQKLREALDRYRDRVLLGVNWERQVTDNVDHNTTRGVFSLPTSDLIPQTLPFDSRLACVNYPSPHEVIRSTWFHLPYQDQYSIPTFPTAVMEKLGLGGEKHQDFGQHIFRFGGPEGTYDMIPVWKLFYDQFWKKSLGNGAYFKNKIVVVGPLGNWAQDTHNTPWGSIPGPEIHLNAISALLHDQFIEESSTWVTVLILILSAILPLVIEWSIHQPLPRLILALLTAFGFWNLLFYLYDVQSLYIPAFSPLLIFCGGSISCISYDFILERMERNRVRSMFERYMSKNVVGQMLDSSEDFQQSLGGARKRVTILFSDIRGFTTMTEGADSHALVIQLNEYLTEMVSCVFSEHGTLDKFIGDAVMGVWGNAITRTPESDCICAVRAALKMYAALARLNDKWESEGKKRLAIGIGINHGEVIVGNMGSPERMEFTVIGDPVNLASRLEGLTKEYHSDILIGETVAPLVKDEFILRTVALVTVKGKTKPVETFSVLGMKGDKLPPVLTELLPIYEEGILQYRNRKFAEAVGTFGRCLKLIPDDFLSAEYLKESLHLMAESPDESWTGVAVMTKK